MNIVLFSGWTYFKQTNLQIGIFSPKYMLQMISLFFSSQFNLV